MTRVSTSHDLLARRIEDLSAMPSTGAMPNDADEVVDALLRALEAGEVRAAERADDGHWRAVPWVKLGILLGFRIGQVIDMTSYDDKGAPARHFFFCGIRSATSDLLLPYRHRC